MKKFTLKHVIGIRWEKFMKKGRVSIKDEEGGNPLHGVTKAKVRFVDCPLWGIKPRFCGSVLNIGT